MGQTVRAMEFELESFLHLTVRLATLGDLDALLSFYTAMWQMVYSGVINNEFLMRVAINPQVQSCFINMLTTGRETARILIAMDGDTIVGLAMGGRYRMAAEPDHAENYALYIHPDYQHRGLGRHLWQLRARMLKSLGARVLHTWVLEPNIQAQQAYKNWGGTPGTPWKRSVDFGDQEMNELHFEWDLEDPAVVATLTNDDKDLYSAV